MGRPMDEDRDDVRPTIGSYKTGRRRDEQQSSEDDYQVLDSRM
jgi:hypothetical protein